MLCVGMDSGGDGDVYDELLAGEVGMLSYRISIRPFKDSHVIVLRATPATFFPGLGRAALEVCVQVDRRRTSARTALQGVRLDLNSSTSTSTLDTRYLHSRSASDISYFVHLHLKANNTASCQSKRLPTNTNATLRHLRLINSALICTPPGNACPTRALMRGP